MATKSTAKTAQATPAAPAAPTPGATSSEAAPSETRLDSDTTKPSTTAPGDGPADTTDPTEQASTVGGDKKAAAEAGHLTVNAVVPVEQPKSRPRKTKDRIEKYEATKPDGTVVTVTHNIDTGETSVS